MSPTVSVIVPNFNHAPYLPQRIDSVLNQTFGDLELILLDDCSTDNSREIIDRYKGNPKISHVVYNEKNSGTTFAQWEKGLALARGKYVWIAESDDYAAPSFLSSLVNLLESNPGAVMAFSGSNIIDSNGGTIPGADWDKFKNNTGKILSYTPYEMISRKLLRNNLVYNASMVIFCRESAPEITSRHMSMKFCGDWLFWFEMAQRGNAIQLCRKLNYFRQHPKKVSTSAAKGGLTYTEGVPIVDEMATYLGLSSIQRKSLAGRICKRLERFPGLLNSNKELQASLCKMARVNRLHPALLIALYETGKLFHISKLPTQV